MKPYVGITGPVRVDEVEAIAQEFGNAGYSMRSTHLPMLGFLVSLKTLRRQPTPNRRYPSIDTLPDLLAQAGTRIFAMIHYNSNEMHTLSDQVSEIFKDVYKEGLCRSIQLNIVGPDITHVGAIMNRFPDMKIVFQASRKVMDGRTPEQVANVISKYGSSIHYVLIDPSGGRGLEFNIENSVRLYEELRSKAPRLTVGFAGGFTGSNVAEKVSQLKARINGDGFCIDAEGGLRDKITNAYGDDLLNIGKVRDYLAGASQVLP
jgi:phosphoribosylanthranilate isomerase